MSPPHPRTVLLEAKLIFGLLVINNCLKIGGYFVFFLNKELWREIIWNNRGCFASRIEDKWESQMLGGLLM